MLESLYFVFPKDLSEAENFVDLVKFTCINPHLYDPNILWLYPLKYSG